MFKDLETQRLILKNISYDDAEFFYQEFSDDEVNRYLFDAEPCSSVEEAKEWIEFYAEPEPRNQQRWVLLRKDTAERIGTCGFHCWNKATGEIELGYDLYPTYWKQGYMTEALTKIIEFAGREMKVRKIYAHISVDNLSSVKAALKQGFVKSGEQYFEEFHGQKYLHDIYVKILSEDAKKEESNE